MQTKPLLYGLIGFFLGGLLVSVASVTFNKNEVQTDHSSMDAMTERLKNLSGDEYDKVFIDDMIAHHQAAVDMAAMSAKQAKHDEVKKLSEEIIVAQTKEIAEMRSWQMFWGYDTAGSPHAGH